MLNKFKSVILVWLAASLTLLVCISYIKFLQDCYISTYFTDSVSKKFSQLPWPKRETILDEMSKLNSRYESHELTDDEFLYSLDKVGFQIMHPDMIKNSNNLVQKYWFQIWLFLLPLMLCVEYILTKQNQKRSK